MAKLGKGTLPSPEPPRPRKSVVSSLRGSAVPRPTQVQRSRTHSTGPMIITRSNSGANQDTTPAMTNRVVGGSRRDSAVRFVIQLFAVVAASALLGGATSFAQTFLPDALRPFANSASGWTLLTALAVAACRARTAPSAVFGAASFVALVLGYQVVSTLRGFPTDETLFLIVGLIVGPFVGIASSWLHRDGWRALLGCGALSGIAVGEGAYGLVKVVDTTGWFYWTLIAVVGVGLLVVTSLHRVHRARGRVLAIVLVFAVGAAFLLAYSAVGEMSGSV